MSLTEAKDEATEPPLFGLRPKYCFIANSIHAEVLMEPTFVFVAG